MSFQFKTYRCEWLAEVYVVDQYGCRQREEDKLCQTAWPTREEAEADLQRVTVPDERGYPGRLLFPGAPHAYYNCDVRYREVLVQDAA